MSTNAADGNVFRKLLQFSLPYFISCFLQTFYGLADLFIIGAYHGAGSITAVSLGSQVTHMLTVVIVGLAMGSTVLIARAVGAGKAEEISAGIGNTVIVFGIFSICLTILLLLSVQMVLKILSTPVEAWKEAKSYLTVCFAGIPFITAYNVISNIFRGIGDTKHPMYFIGIAGVFNIILDYALIGGLGLGAFGAALATVSAQAVSVLAAIVALKKLQLGIVLCKKDFRPRPKLIAQILKVGIPVSVQDALIQIAFLVITVIANRRSVEVAAAVGISEKLIGFFFLVPSAMLASISALAAQNAGAGRHDRAKQTLFYGMALSAGVGCCFSIVCQFAAKPILGMFAGQEPEVIFLGSQYLRSYIWDCMIAGIHFCFSGFFCAYQRSILSFIHNLASILLVRIPGAYMASVCYPDSLYPMGAAAPAGSLLSAVICLIFYRLFFSQASKDVVRKECMK